MSWTTKMTAVFLVFVFLWLSQEQFQTMDVTRQVLKSAANKAAHDALRAIDLDDVRDGRVIISEGQARRLFEDSLKANLSLDDNLEQTSGPFALKVNILHFEVKNEHDYPPDFRTKGYFEYELAEHGMFKLLRGPAVIAVISTQSVPVLAMYAPEEIRASAISEYQYPMGQLE